MTFDVADLWTVHPIIKDQMVCSLHQSGFSCSSRKKTTNDHMHCTGEKSCGLDLFSAPVSKQLPYGVHPNVKGKNLANTGKKTYQMRIFQGCLHGDRHPFVDVQLCSGKRCHIIAS